MLKHEHDVSIDRRDKILKFGWHNHQIRVRQDSTNLDVSWDGEHRHSLRHSYIMETWDFDSYFAMTFWNEKINIYLYYTLNRSGQIFGIQLGSNYIKYIPIKFDFNHKDNFYYPKVFKSLAFGILMCLKKKKLPRLLIVKKIFEPVWNHLRQIMLTDILCLRRDRFLLFYGDN